MAYSLVGSAGAVTLGSTGAAVTPAWGAGTSQTAGNLLLLMIAGWGGAANPLPSGWSTGAEGGSGSLTTAVYFRLAAGGDAAPTVDATVGMTWAAQLIEFSGNATSSPLDRATGSDNVGLTLTLAAPGADAGRGELVAWAVAEGSTVTTTALTEHTGSPNNGMTAHDVTNNSTSTGNHYLFGWGITTGNSVADASTFDVDSTMSADGVLVSFKVAPEMRALTGSLTLSQSLAASLTLTTPLTGTLTLSQSLAGRVTFTRPLAGTLRLAQSFARLLQIGSALADGLRLAGPPAPTPTESNLQGR